MSAPASSVAGAAVSGLKALLGLQLITKVFSFAINLIVIRFAEKRAYGFATVHLHLLLTTAVYLSREGVRRSLLRLKHGEKTKGFQYFSWVPLVVSLPLGAVLFYFGQSAAASVFHTQPKLYNDSIYAMLITLFAAVIELCGEPAYNTLMAKMMYSERAYAEGMAILARGVSTAGFLFMGISDLQAFALAHLSHSCVLVLLYASTVVRKTGTNWKEVVVPWGQKSGEVENVEGDDSIKKVAVQFSLQSLQKLLLAEGEKIVLVLFLDLSGEEGGIFGLVHNLGSLVARLFFAPIEEIAFASFSKMGEKDKSDQAVYVRGIRILPHLMMIFGLFLSVFGFSYSFELLHILYGEKWSSTSAPSVLSLFTLYVLIMGMNGVTEAYMQARASAADISFTNKISFAFSAVYLGLAIVLGNRYGIYGLILANILNLGLRWAYASLYIHRDAGRGVVSYWFPSLPALLVFAVSGAACAGSRLFLYSEWFPTAISWTASGMHIAVGGVVTLICAGVVYKLERGFIHDLRSFISSAKENKTE
mmetsp:Transcript_10710/g.28080  ORF Transcript_10710/g.28080 Transcript_10710/m.28080 type:complete len:533 (-) Transcript_10710:130-1728(-)|eukprot:CAMPEP_0113898582 /NCGR_PEP_ID=MMETSP0780_2-20120614/19479_1 /TAXON_ID=652834 /ORGANISM="Palpitomonas bilix" /LENGTH=532 /DNA_ID=CAMNT_0000890501 /DNA_START=233 /DNA_END=1831 /DNA_ORIENTATION=- /assembly_acc=CAM_ASM_000599